MTAREDKYFSSLEDIGDRVDAAVDAALKQTPTKSEFAETLKNGPRKNMVIYSAYDLLYDSEAKDEIPVDNLDEIPYKGTYVLVYDSHWGDRTYQSGPFTDATWLELCVLANEAINYSGDDHHIFFEGVGLSKCHKELILFTGS